MHGDWLTCLSSHCIPILLMCPFFTNELILACLNWIVGSVTSRCSGNECAFSPEKTLRGAYPRERRRLVNSGKPSVEVPNSMKHKYARNR